MTEEEIVGVVRKRHATESRSVLLRNNSGMAYYGHISGGVLRHPSIVKYGLGGKPGSSDLIGFKPTVVTADMVGSTLAVFMAVEVKTGRTALSPEQAAFLRAVKAAGGVAFVERTDRDGEPIAGLKSDDFSAVV